MRICIFGAGSIGSALGGFLAGSNEVVLVGRRPHMNEIRRNGLKLLGDGARTVRLEATESIRDLTPPELLVVTTKAYDTVNVVRACRPWTHKDTLVLTLQNGLGNLEILRAWKGSRAIGGTTTMGATLISPGKVRVSGMGLTVIGSDREASVAVRLSRIFRESGIPSSVEKNIANEIWAKAIVSACINPVTAVLRVPNGRILDSPAISRLTREICRECLEVARLKGIRLNPQSVFARVCAVARDTSENLSSMLQDVERGKRTEIDQISGAFSRIGKERGIGTPLNNALAAMIGALDERTHSQKG